MTEDEQKRGRVENALIWKAEQAVVGRAGVPDGRQEGSLMKEEKLES